MSKPRDVDGYIANSAGAARPALEELREIIKSTVPEAEEGISWGVPFYNYHGPLAGFAAYKSHVSFGVGAGVLHAKDRRMLEAEGYKIGKKTIRIRFDQRVPTAAIRQILNARAAMNEAARAIM